jgi:hypothetical protein
VRARLTIALIGVALALAAVAPAPALAGSTAKVCVFRAAVHDTPRGIVVGYLHDGARVKLRGHTPNRRWYRIRGPLSLAGWMKRKHLCT